MKPAAFEYCRPAGLPEALRALSDANGAAKLLAGGQSLAPMLNLRLARPALLVDISRLEALQGIDAAGSVIRIGAATTHAAIEDAGESLPHDMLRSVAAGIAYRAVRNRGTIGGSLAHADPAADWPLALAALAATVIVAGPRGSRQIPAELFMSAGFTTALAEDEIIEAIEVPRPGAGWRWGYFKFCRKTGEFPDASAAVVIDRERGLVRIAVGALDGPPRLLDALARDVAALGTVAVNSRSLDLALAAAAPGLDAVDRRLHAAVLDRALGQALP